MKITNTENNYGIVTILLHWLLAILIVGLFVLGVYMVDLDYYDSWYNAAPWLHKSVGIGVFFLSLIRIAWALGNQRPMPLPTHKQWEIIAARITHILFYVLLIIICISGYFITTTKGASIDMFGLFNIPAVTRLNENQAVISGEIHEIAAYVMAFLFLLHVCATFKHHYVDKDVTFIRILKQIKQKENK